MSPGGYNPIRWKCETDGCFNIKCRPKIQAFAECFPGNINFGDVDGIVEISGRFCMLEWKGDRGRVRMGQDITYRAFTRRLGNIVFVVEGNAETMRINRYCIYWLGKAHDWVAADFGALKTRVRGWSAYARRQQIRAVSA